MEGPKPIVPLRGRYASKEMKALFPLDEASDYRYQCSSGMREIFSDDAKYLGWRRNWVVLAESQYELGLVTKPQLDALRLMEKAIDIEKAKRYERELKHDVMAFIREYQDQVRSVNPEAGKIIHQGETSCYITDNEELTAMRKALGLTISKAQQLQDMHGARNLLPVIEILRYQHDALLGRGAKGTTGTQASHLELFNGDHSKVIRLDELVSQKMGFSGSYTITGQTYPRIVDYQVLSAVALLAQSLLEMSPEDSDNINETLRFTYDIFNKSKQAAHMASSQWLERSLDDSSERRIIVAESFYQIDYLLDKILTVKHIETPSLVGLQDKEIKGLDLIMSKTVSAIDRIHGFAEINRNTFCTAYTHGQFAQPTTEGKRLDLWDYNFVLALKDIEHTIQTAPSMSRMTLDYLINTRLTQLAVASAKMAVDVRLLQHDLEINEPFGISQVGSTAMAFKKNPMKAERVNGLARNKIGSINELGLTPYDWFNTDAVLELVLAIFSGNTERQNGFTVHEYMARKRLDSFMPFLAAENIMMEAVKAGGDRQELHEQVRQASLEARANVDRGEENNMLVLLRDKHGFPIDLTHAAKYLNPETHVGRSREQVDEFGKKEIAPLKEKYSRLLGKEGDVQI